MQQRLLIRYRGPQLPLEWLSEDERGRVLTGPASGTAPPAPLLAAAGEIVVLAPAEDILLLETRVAARSASQLARAIPFAVEDQVAEPVESLQFAAIAIPGAGQLVAAARRQQLLSWIEDLHSRGIRADRLVPDALLLAHDPSVVCVLLDGTRVLVRAGLARVFAVENAQLAQWLELGAPVRDPDGRIRVRIVGEGALALDPARFALERDGAAQHPLVVLAAGLRGNAAVPDLLSGQFAPQHRGAPARRLWQRTAIAAGLAVIAAFAFALLDQYLLGQRAQELREQLVVVHSQVYPGSNVPLDVAGRMRADYRALGGVRGQGGALDLLAQVAPLLSASPQTFLKAAEYRGGTLEVVVIAPAVSSLDQLREAISVLPGVSAELSAANSTERGTEGRIRIVRRPS